MQDPARELRRILVLTAGCIDTELPAGRGYSGQSGKPLIEIAHVHHAMWLMSTETRCETVRKASDVPAT
jgi:hypothetical protein